MLIVSWTCPQHMVEGLFVKMMEEFGLIHWIDDKPYLETVKPQ